MEFNKIWDAWIERQDTSDTLLSLITIPLKMPLCPILLCSMICMKTTWYIDILFSQFKFFSKKLIYCSTLVLLSLCVGFFFCEFWFFSYCFLCVLYIQLLKGYFFFIPSNQLFVLYPLFLWMIILSYAWCMVNKVTYT